MSTHCLPDVSDHELKSAGFSLVTVVMWGLLPVALKAILHVMDPITISWYRFSLSALIAALWYGNRRRQELKRLAFGRHWALSLAAIAGLIGNYMLYILGLDHINPGARNPDSTRPAAASGGQRSDFHERFSATQWLGSPALRRHVVIFHRRSTTWC
jgi:hypothetical protein